jgi:UDP-N-acetyl-D-mannosaminuronate dehydrogenase
MDLLSERGAALEYYDPYLPVIKPTREHSHWAGKKSVEWDRATVESFDLVLIATNHSCVNYQDLADWAQCVVDTRNAMSGTRYDLPKLESIGYRAWQTLPKKPTDGFHALNVGIAIV